MTINVYLVDKDGEEIERNGEYVDKHFNWLRNPCGIHQFLKDNFNIDIRYYPFFEYDKMFENYYPTKLQKEIMSLTIKHLRQDIENTSKLYLKFADSKSFTQCAGSARELKYENGKVLLPKIDDVEDILAKLLSEEAYRKRCYQFCDLIDELCKDGIGYHVHD